MKQSGRSKECLSAMAVMVADEQIEHTGTVRMFLMKNRRERRKCICFGREVK